MNGKISKKIRKEVYGDLSIWSRELFKNPQTGQILADELRARYQRVKGLYKARKRNNDKGNPENSQRFGKSPQ